MPTERSPVAEVDLDQAGELIPMSEEKDDGVRAEPPFPAAR